MNRFLCASLFVASTALLSCQTASTTTVASSADSAVAEKTDSATSETAKAADPSTVKVASAATILARKQVPVLCYHQIRDWKPTDSKTAKDYIVPIQAFKDQIKMLADSGYHTISTDQLYDYLNTGAALPSKPILLTFDDTDLDQYTIAAPTLKKYGFKAMYFIMTVSLGRPHYMSSEQVKALSDEGNEIGSHTWDHHNFKKYQGKDWETQIDKPTKKLEEITGKKMKYFAYPFGLWNAEGIPELKKRGFLAAFQLAEKRDQNDPLFTIRRIIASGYWAPKTLRNSIVNSF
ncbi:polysaccharide deacetylase family protein [Pedobacter sp. HMF7647]|uniref:Polysaccharide deacetylase family protein n=1 Tax=Hufsiella arboris TaxID=2695275 RepID=A0A7K1YC38_9SPHI|nr:polysaccharide deacetylase family protein [Hufsiella arboris]MXV52135.1 polysaccharide deacetylase family protein [Hufsiella arboris]